MTDDIAARLTAVEEKLKETADSRWACLAAVAAVVVGLTAKKVFDETDHDRIINLAEELAMRLTELNGAMGLGAVFDPRLRRRRKRSRRR